METHFIVMSTIPKQIIPKHIAVIMDGNGRWAKERDLPRIEGHKNGVESVRTLLEESVRIGVRYITVYAFSSENWSRPQVEVDGLMRLFADNLKNELPTFMKQGIKLLAIGDREKLPEDVVRNLEFCEKETENNDTLTFIIAVSYGGRDEILRAVKKIASDVSNKQSAVSEIDESFFESYLDTSSVPDPDLLIRTSGEMRISNFLLWQLAYTEIIILSKYWPDFSAKDLRGCIEKFNQRERRYGLSK